MSCIILNKDIAQKTYNNIKHFYALISQLYCNYIVIITDTLWFSENRKV